MNLITFTDMALLDQGMRSSLVRSGSEGLAMAMISIHEELSPKPTKEDGLTKVRGKNEPEQTRMRRVVSLPEEYSSAEEVWYMREVWYTRKVGSVMQAPSLRDPRF